MGLVKPIALVGLMGAGKSAVAEALGRRCDGPVLDLDARIEARAGVAIAALFEAQGEPAFRSLETAELERALGERLDAIACGGGVALGERNRELLRERCHTVWLDVAPAIAAQRVAATSARRPLLGDGPAEPRLAALLAERAPGYAAVSIVRLDSSRHSPDAVAGLVLASLAGRGA